MVGSIEWSISKPLKPIPLLESLSNILYQRGEGMHIKKLYSRKSEFSNRYPKNG